MNDTLLQIICK